VTRSLSTRVRSTQEPMTVKRRNHGRSKPAGARGRVKRVRAALTKKEPGAVLDSGLPALGNSVVERSHKLERQCQWCI